MAFETSIYTDVRADEAVDGVDGFNFQAVSHGIDGTDQNTIREHMLHQISTQWPIERAERDHPPSAAFMTRDGRFYFARGISTGTTENGRRGNQLTQAVVTRSAEDIRPYRPAQLFGAVNWSLEKAKGTACDPWFAPLELDGDFEADSLLAWLRSDAWLQKVLPAYLTMLEGALGDNPRKVVIIHADLKVVMRWMALGTLLLDAQAANGLEFRAFVADPFQTSARLVGMHPEMTRGPVAGAHVINLSERTHSDIDTSESALAVLDWTLRLDTFDALEVIDIAQRWMPAIGVRHGAAGAEMVTGTRVAQVGREEWDLGVAIIEGLASNGLRSDLELYLDELAEAVSSYRLQSDDDFARAARATRFAAGSDIPGLAGAILVPSLESLAAAPEYAMTWVREMNPDGRWTWPDVDSPEALAENLSQVILGAPAPSLVPLLVLAKPLAALLPSTQLRPAADRAARHLRENNALSREIDSCYGADRIRTVLRAQLLAEMLATDPAAPSAVFGELRAGDWDFLDHRSHEQITDTSVPFLRWLSAARVARQDVATREDYLRTIAAPPGQESWWRVLADTKLPQDAGLWTAWVEIVGANADMQHDVLRRVQHVVQQPPKEAKPKETQRWEPILRALAAKQPNEPRLETATAALSDFIASIPSFKDRASEVSGQVKGFFTGRTKEQ